MQPVNLHVPDFLLHRPRGYSARQFSPMSFDIRDTANGAAELLVYNGVGDKDGANATSVAQVLRQNRSAPILVRINSPGGYAWDGITIYNALLAHNGKVTTLVEGQAGSAASIIMCAGKPAQAYPSSTVFIHRASATVVGNRDVMEEVTKWLDQLDEAIAGIYSARTGKAKSMMLNLMRGTLDGTSMDAFEAKRLGLIDEVIDNKKNRVAAAMSKRGRPWDSYEEFHRKLAAVKAGDHGAFRRQ